MSVTGQQVKADTVSAGTPPPVAVGATMPVFRGLDNVDISDKEIAAITGVTGPTFSKWRSGRTQIPECKLVLLTLLLAHWIDEQEILLDCREKEVALKEALRLKTTRRCLMQQDIINQSLPPETVRKGSHQFRQWWFQEDVNAPAIVKLAS